MKNQKISTKKEKQPTDIMSLAHAGTKEAVAKLEKLVISERDQDKKEFLKTALEECRQIYFEPKNKKEEEEFILLKIINQKEVRWLREQMKVQGLQEEVRFAKAEMKVQERILKEVSKKEKEMAEIACFAGHDILVWQEDRLAEAEKNLSDIKTWIETAEKMIKTPRYQNLPYDFMESVHFDNEGLEDLFESGNFNHDDGDSCCLAE